MGLYMILAMKDAVEDDVWPLHSRTDGNVEDVFSGGAAAIEEMMRRLRTSLERAVHLQAVEGLVGGVTFLAGAISLKFSTPFW
jgi:hypothetical protein